MNVFWATNTLIHESCSENADVFVLNLFILFNCLFVFIFKNFFFIKNVLGFYVTR